MSMMMAPSAVQVFIPAALNRPSHTLYSICICVQPTEQEWTVNRRYSQMLELRKELIAMLGAQRSCPSCASFCLALRKFAFPPKTWLRTNRVVRRRVTALQGFLQLIVQRVYNDLPKCAACGDQVRKTMRTFLIRGAQPIGPTSCVSKIQQSLSLQSYAIVERSARHDQDDTSKGHMHESPADSTASSQATTSDDSPKHGQALSDSRTTSSQSLADSLDSNDKCRDAPVPLEEALQQVVLADARNSTVEEIAYRLSTMWAAYDLRETTQRLTNMRITTPQVRDNAPEEEDDDDEF